MPGLFIGAALTLAAGGVWGIALILSGGPAAQVLGLSIMAGTVVGALGMVLSRGRWALVHSRLMLTSMLGLALITRPAGWQPAIALAAVALVISITTWGRRGLRQLPPAEPIPPPALILPLGLLLLPAPAALPVIEDGSAWLWPWAAIAWILAFAYARAWQPALWLIRIGLIPLTLGFAFVIGGLAGVLATLGAAALTTISWSRQALVAVTDAAPRLVSPVPMPPELVPEDMMRAAGYDTSGRPLSEDRD